MWRQQIWSAGSVLAELDARRSDQYISEINNLPVGLVDGSVHRFAPSQFPSALDAQNAIRAEYELPALWHPDHVPAQQPQAASDG